MRITCRHSLPILVLSGFLTAAPTPTSAQSPTTDPQIVRLSYVEGDVRISRGNLADKELRAQGENATGWEQATANLPIESGYSMVTGKGRAEIEFEDASVVYLADNSVLSFTEVSSTGGVPYTQIALLSGTATMDVHTFTRGEVFRLTTPTDQVKLMYPQKADLRVDSYLDAIAITPQRDGSLDMLAQLAPQSQLVGRTLTFRGGHRVLNPAPPDQATSAAWDNWVAARVDARDKAMSAAMKDAGLTEPVPGLADMNGKGSFFPCAPYGTCWAPTNGWVANTTSAAQTQPMPAAAAGAQGPQPASAPPVPDPHTVSVADLQKNPNVSPPANPYLTNHPGAVLWTEDYTFPCSAYAYSDLMARDPVTGQVFLVSSNYLPFGGPFFAGNPYFARYSRQGFGPFFGFNGYYGGDPWDWAICHAGSWVRWQHRYVWVAGWKRHHHPPVHWGKTGRTVGFVPIHPHDVAGKVPVNLKDGLFRVTGKHDSAIERVAVDDGKPLKLLDEPPKELRQPFLEPLKIAQAPQAMAHSAFNSTVASAAKASVEAKGSVAKPTSVGGSAPTKGFAAREPGTPITFDRKSQSFSVATQVMAGGRTTTVTEPLGGRGGNFQAGNNGSSASRGSNSPSYNNNSGGASRSSAPSYSGGNSNAGASSRASAPAPAPSYSPPPSSSSSSAAPSGGSSPHK